jgi:hypothetical protein
MTTVATSGLSTLATGPTNVGTGNCWPPSCGVGGSHPHRQTTGTSQSRVQQVPVTFSYSSLVFAQADACAFLSAPIGRRVTAPVIRRGLLETLLVLRLVAAQAAASSVTGGIAATACPSTSVYLAANTAGDLLWWTARGRWLRYLALLPPRHDPEQRGDNISQRIVERRRRT